MACLKGELDTYTKYLNGEVVGFRTFTVEKCDACGHEEEVEIDSCWGFYSAEEAEDAAGWKDEPVQPNPQPAPVK